MIVDNNPKDKLDIAIIGGGLSGLLALKSVIEANRNLKVHLFEANDRVGGRVFTYEKSGIKLEKGASWIGPTQTRMYELLKEFNIGTIPQYETGKNQIAYKGSDNYSEYLVIGLIATLILTVIFKFSVITTITIVIGLITLLIVYLGKFADQKLYNLRKFYKGTIPPISIRALIKFAIIQWQLDYYASKINLEDPFSSPNAAEFDAVNLKEWVVKKLGKDSDVFKVFECATDTIFGLDMNKMSFLHALFYIKSAGNLDMLINGKGGAQQDRIQGGSSALPLAIYQKLHKFITLSKPVVEINKKDNKQVEIIFEDKTVIQVKKIIVAVPPHVLAKSIRFFGIPQKKIDFFKAVQSGELLKLFAVFKQPFWRQNGLSGQVLSTENQPCLIFDVSSDTHGILLGFLVISHAPFYQSLDHTAKKDYFLNHLGKFFGEQQIFENFIMFSDDNYQDDKYAVGCPVASMPVDGWKDFGYCWKQPIDNVIFWASTETSTIWNGYMEGAVRAGERAAKEVLIDFE